MTALLSVGLVMAVPARSDAFIGEIIGLVKDVGTAVSRAAKVMKWSQTAMEVATYPNEYIREANSIMADIEALKQMAAQASLSVDDMNRFLQLSQQYIKVLDTSLKEFEGIVDIITESFSVMMTDAGQGVNMEEVIQRVKSMHKNNMQALSGARRIVNNTKALVSNCHAANTVINNAARLK